MKELVELTYADHATLKVVENCAVDIAKKQHIINLRVTEVGKAACVFPVFLIRAANTGDWSLSAVSSLEVEDNLFVRDNQWHAEYIPVSMQTYPFFLMNSKSEKGGYTVGIDQDSEAFSNEEGESLFDDKGKASVFLSQVTALLDDDIKNTIHTFKFVKKMDELGLIKPMNIKVFYEDEQVNNLNGLHSIDEEKLQSLDLSTLDELRNLGYLAPIYALLISIYQLNGLITKHNIRGAGAKITQVKMEVVKDQVSQ